MKKKLFIKEIANMITEYSRSVGEDPLVIADDIYEVVLLHEDHERLEELKNLRKGEGQWIEK